MKYTMLDSFRCSDVTIVNPLPAYNTCKSYRLHFLGYISEVVQNISDTLMRRVLEFRVLELL